MSLETTINSTSSPAPLIKIALLQMEGQGFDQQANLTKADKYCRRAAASGADIALMPEMYNIGYTGFNGTDEQAVKEWQNHAVSRESSWLKHFKSLASELNMAIGVTYLEKVDGKAPRNTISLVDRHGDSVLTYAKVHTCDFSNFESACTPGDDWYVATLDTSSGPVQVGAMICYDREFPESARTLMIKGAELILTPNACPLDDMRHHQFQSRAFENATAVFMTNYAGPIHQGRSVAYNADGNELAVMGHSEGIEIIPLDIGFVRQYQKTSIWGNAYRRPHKYKTLLNMDVSDVYKRNFGLGGDFDRVIR